MRTLDLHRTVPPGARVLPLPLNPRNARTDLYAHVSQTTREQVNRSLPDDAVREALTIMRGRGLTVETRAALATHSLMAAANRLARINGWPALPHCTAGGAK